MDLPDIVKFIKDMAIKKMMRGALHNATV